MRRWRFPTWDDDRREKIWGCACGNAFHTISIAYWLTNDDGDQSETYFDLSFGTHDHPFHRRVYEAWRCLRGKAFLDAEVVLTPRQVAEVYDAIGQRLAELRQEETPRAARQPSVQTTGGAPCPLATSQNPVSARPPSTTPDKSSATCTT